MTRSGGNRAKIFALTALAALAAGAIVFECSDGPEESVPAAAGPSAAPASPGARPFLVQPEPAAEPAEAASGIDEVACAACEKQHVTAGDCEPDSGCEGLGGADKDLCLNLLACQRRTNCWVNHPLDCLCGTAPGVACAQGAANGACRAEIQAATKTTDPIKNGTLFFDPTLPAGRANRLIACAFDNCKSVCSPKGPGKDQPAEPR
jgi:hypothetical protein